MLRAISSIYIESQVLAVARRDVFKSFRTTAYAGISTNKTVLSEANFQKKAPVVSSPPPEPTPPLGSPTGTPTGSPPPRLGWVAAAAIAFTASVGGVYFFRKLNTNEEPHLPTGEKTDRVQEILELPIPASPEFLPEKVDYLVVGAGTAAFAALRALRSLRPEASVLLVGDERALPYMRPPLTKELWREPDLVERASDPDTLIFSQWNGKKRRLAYEPSIFYTPTEKLREGSEGAGVARGWTVSALDVDEHTATVTSVGGTATLSYGKCLIATGVRSVRAGAVERARAAGRSLAVRSARDLARLAELVQRAPAGRVLLLGGGAQACELAAGLAHALRDSEKSVVQVFKEESPLADLLPRYLAADAGRRLRELGVTLLPNTEVVDSIVDGERVQLKLMRVMDEQEGEATELVESTLDASLVVECVGTEPNTALAEAAGLEVHPELGGIVVNAEMQARTDVFAAGDVACYHEPVLGRRRVARHDHAVASGRLAGTNMAAAGPARAYSHQPMLWSDIGPEVGLEAIGIIDSALPTVSVFSEDAVSDVTSSAESPRAAEAVAVAAASEGAVGVAGGRSGEREERSYERGVVFYLCGRRVVGVLLWNLFNRMHVARQVLKQGEFEDLFEVAKLFSLHEDD